LVSNTEEVRLNLYKSFGGHLMQSIVVHNNQEVDSYCLPQFDLTIIAEQIIHKAGYQDWEGSRIESALEEYKKFLSLCKTYPNTPIIPGRDVDTVWHRHILNVVYLYVKKKK
jgi:hypothetical protein